MEICILTKSAKYNNYCVAGINLATNKLIRLVSDDQSIEYALTKQHLTCNNGYQCQIFDIINVENIIHKPLPLQKENYYITRPLKYINRLNNPYEFIMQKNIIELKNTLFLGSLNYSLDDNEIKKLCGKSLFIYHVNNLSISKSIYNKKSKASFILNNMLYTNISITDFDYFNYEQNDIQDCLIVASLPNKPWEGKYFKFIAKIIPKTDELFYTKFSKIF